MRDRYLDIRESNQTWATMNIGSVSVGRIVQITEDSRPIVDFPGNEVGPVQARSIVAAPLAFGRLVSDAAPVLLVFENGDPTLPVIIGFIHDTLAPFPERNITVAADNSEQVTIDVSRLLVTAKEELVLRCGKTSITLKKDGKVVILGGDVVSRASGTNKLKGSSVTIN